MDPSGTDLPAGAHVFLCGPPGFLRAVRPALLEAGTAESRLHSELFSPNDWLL